MTNSENTPRFIPLNQSSQCNNTNVLYYDKHTPIESILECATGRLSAILGLVESLHEYNNPPPYAVQNIAIVSTILLSDVMSLINMIQSITKDR